MANAMDVTRFLVALLFPQYVYHSSGRWTLVATGVFSLFEVATHGYDYFPAGGIDPERMLTMFYTTGFCYIMKEATKFWFAGTSSKFLNYFLASFAAWSLLLPARFGKDVLVDRITLYRTGGRRDLFSLSLLASAIIMFIRWDTFFVPGEYVQSFITCFSMFGGLFNVSQHVFVAAIRLNPLARQILGDLPGPPPQQQINWEEIRDMHGFLALRHPA